MDERRIRWQDLELPGSKPDRPVLEHVGRPVTDRLLFDAPATPLSLVGCYDPLDGTVLEEGERAVICLSCQTGYHQTSWDFLAQRNHGACANCKKSSSFTVLRLVAGDAPTTLHTDAYSEIVRLGQLPGRVGHVVVFEGFVFAHQISSRSGTHFVKFHADSNPFKGFKLVIFEDDVHKWRNRGIDPASYAKNTIQVRGLLKDHPTFGLEILPKTPAQIRVIPAS